MDVEIKIRIKNSIVKLLKNIERQSTLKDSCNYVIVKGERKSQTCGDKITYVDPELKYCSKHRICTKSYKIVERKEEKAVEKFIDLATLRASCIELVV